MKKPVTYGGSEPHMGTIRPLTDKLQEIASDFPGADIDPVDSFGGYVAVDKYASDNLEETQDNITWKVGLKPTNPLNPWETEVRRK